MAGGSRLRALVVRCALVLHFRCVTVVVLAVRCALVLFVVDRLVASIGVDVATSVGCKLENILSFVGNGFKER